MTGAFFLFLVVAVSAQTTTPINRAPRFLTVDGKRVDTCARPSWETLGTVQGGVFDWAAGGLNIPNSAALPGAPGSGDFLNVERLNCPSQPAQSSTIFLPSNLPPAFPIPTRVITFTMEGNSAGPGTSPLPVFPAAPGVPAGNNNAQGFVCLSQMNQPCSSGCDLANFDIYPVAQGNPILPVVATPGNPTSYTFTYSTGSPNNWMRAPAAAVVPGGGTPGLINEPIGSRRLCFQAHANSVQALWTGAYIAVDFDCNLNNGICPPALTIQGRTQCCLSAVQVNKIGICYDPNIQSCCGAGFARKSIEKCCSNALEFTQTLGQACPCSNTVPCATELSNPEPETSCCLHTKYPDLTNPLVVAGRLDGQCFNPAVHRCCNVGQRFDPGTQQCCTINGLQSRDLPCPCSSNAHCSTSTDGSNENQGNTCCQQTRPALGEVQQCSAYLNYPSGNGRLETQACLGLCNNPLFQICCNGRVCQRAFEKCCNDTCCNRYIGSCEQSRRYGAPRQVFNWLLNHPANDQIRFRTGSFITCSIVEQMSVVKAFFVFILPTFLLAAMILGLALALVFANQVSARLFTLEERALIVFGILTTLFAFPLFFSPFWKFGVVVQVAAIIAIIAAAALNFPLAVFAAVIALIATFYIIDPFHGNGYLNFAEGRLDNGDIDPWTSGVLWSVYKMWREVEPGRINAEITRDTRFCTRYYDYFAFDYGVQDFVRFDNPAVTTFGYCSRGWTFTLLMFSGFMLIFMILTLALLLMVALQRFRKDVYEPIELEIRDAGQVMDPFLG